MPTLERLHRNLIPEYDEYPPFVDYSWTTLNNLPVSTQQNLEDQYSQSKSVVKDILFMSGYDEELNLAGFVLNNAKTVLYYGNRLPTLQGELLMKENGFETVQRTKVVPCNFDLQYLYEINTFGYVFSKFRIAPDEMYQESRDLIIGGANQLLTSLNRNTIPHF